MPGAASTFCVIFLPDTQYYSESYPTTFERQTQWIADNREALNIQVVLHEGDVVNQEGSQSHWQNADAAIKILDRATTPYLIALGNHDYPGFGQSRDSGNFNAYFPQRRYTEKSWWQGGFYEAEKSENAYLLMTINDKDYIFLSLEFGPREGVITWADTVLTAYPNHTAVIVTHAYLTRFGQRYNHHTGDQYNPHNYQLDGDINDAEELWTKLIKRHRNILWVQSGHDFPEGGAAEARLASMGDHGNTVKQAVANYQALANGGEGYLWIATFNPTSGLVSIQTYSPTLDAFLTGSPHEFTL